MRRNNNLIASTLNRLIMVALLWVLASPGHGSDQIPAKRQDHPIALVGPGVPFCIGFSGREASNARNLAYHAAMAAAYGLPKEEALKSITIYPAQVLGVTDRVGSIEVGKDATLIVTDGDPLEITTQVEQEFIQGRTIDLTSRHTQLYEKYKMKYEELKKQTLMTTKSSE